MASWGVVTTTIEPAEVLVPFVAHHLALGAARVHIYLDRPEPEIAALLQNIAGCDVTPCTDAHWANASSKGRPNSLEHRQVINAQHAYTRAETDWLAHLDTDEFVRSTWPLDQELSQVPEVFSLVRLAMRERVHLADDPADTIFGGAVRVPFTGRYRHGLALLGEVLHYTNGGLAGHDVGKSFVRTGRQDLLMGIHKPRPIDRSDPAHQRPWALTSASSVLVHFDGMTPMHWVAKMRRYVDRGLPDQAANITKSRLRMLRRVDRLKDDPPGLLAFHDLLKSVSEADHTRLRALGLIEDLGIDPVAAISTVGVGAPLDLSPAAYDRMLGAEAAG